MSTEPNHREQAGTGEVGSSAAHAQPAPEDAAQTTGYPQADRKYAGSRDEGAEGGVDPRPGTPQRDEGKNT